MNLRISDIVNQLYIEHIEYSAEEHVASQYKAGIWKQFRFLCILW